MTTTRRHRRAGFTLVEVMIVIAIILALTGLVGIALFQQRDQSKIDLVKIDMNNLRNALRLFRADFDRWPTDEEGLSVLWDKAVLSPEADAARWKQYLDEPLSADRWGNPWGYRQQSEQGDQTNYDIWSLGPDQQEGTDDDINSWARAAGAGGGSESGSGEAPPPATGSGGGG